MAHASRFFDGPAGRLDARLHGPASGDPVMVLHPHPRFGGSMGSRLVFDLATGLGDAGFHAVRFDFRGVGRSGGGYGDGDGEADDAVAVFDALSRHGAAPVVVGFSFGGGVAVRLATRRRPRHLVLVATPLRLTESRLVPLEDAAGVQGDVCVVVGSRDGFVAVGDAERLAAAFPRPAELKVLQDAGHFLRPDHNARAVEAVLGCLRP